MADSEPRDVNLKSSSDSDDDDDMNDDTEAQNVAKLMELEAALKEDPYHYDSHVARIVTLKELGELDQLRSARETFAKLYPLSPELWLAWVKDERGLATSDEDNQKIAQLFARGVEDYVSIDLWLEYCQFSLSEVGKEGGIEKARDVFERAITAVGLHVAKGALVWEAYREFEAAISGLVSNAEGQRKRIDKIFRRQLSVPLLDMDSTYAEYKTWLGGDVAVDRSVDQQYEAARNLLKDLESLETQLLSDSQADRAEAFKKYESFEVRSGRPERIVSIFERHITDDCLNAAVWTDYLDYLDRQLKVQNVSISAHERSVRNCPWSSRLWISYLRALERYKKDSQDIVAVFERAVACGFGDPTDYQKLWLAFIDYRRRSRHADDNDKEKAEEQDKSFEEELSELFSRAVDHLARVKGDPECKVARYWAWVEGDLHRKMNEARQIWSDVLAVVGDNWQPWNEYINLEKSFGDSKHLRKLFARALERCQDWPEFIGDCWIQFEREEGSLDDLELAERKVRERCEKINQKRSEAEEVERRKDDRRKEKDKEKRREKRHVEAERKRKAVVEEPLKDSEFKVPVLPAKKPKVAPPPGFEEETRPKEPEVAKDSCTVFVSNLDFSVSEEDLRAFMTASGTVNEIRLIKTPSGKSKGFAYVEFSSSIEAEQARERDHEPLKGRPVFISECNPEKRHKFRYAVGLEKNKLFVKGLPVTMTQEDVGKLFVEYGTLKEVRLVTYRNGHSKGIAFVEFEDETSASSAVVKADGRKVQGKVISVALSNPPERSKATKNSQPKSFGDGARSSKTGDRPKAQMALLPRALMKPDTNAVNGGASSDGEKQAPKSNQDFREMLLKKN